MDVPTSVDSAEPASSSNLMDNYADSALPSLQSTKSMLELASPTAGTPQPAMKKSNSAVISKKKRKHSHLTLDPEYGAESDDVPKLKEPKSWREVISLIEEKRETIVAPVDTVGADSLGDWEQVKRGELEPKHARFRTLLALMLSSQTKDQVTAAAMQNLKARFVPLTVASMLNATPEEVDQCISKVGFHIRKSQYITQTVKILNEEYDGDVPDTITAITDLPGVGPKMGFLLMQIAWKKTIGIGVDTHVHRISNRLGWVDTKTPEETRSRLQAWLPKDYWESINKTLVGYGQSICLPIGPKCGDCPVNKLCPSADLSRTKKK
jgi:endonuclease-3